MQEDMAINVLQESQYFASGKRGDIYVSELGDQKYLIKKLKKTSTKSDVIYKEYLFGKKLERINIAPVHHYKDPQNEFLIRDYVAGDQIRDYIQVCDKKSMEKIIKDLLDLARKLDVNLIDKKELNHPHKDIIITKNIDCVIIDYERCKYSVNPKNVSQIIQFITGQNMADHLFRFNIKLDIKKIRCLTKRYKNNQTKENFGTIRIAVLEKFD